MKGLMKLVLPIVVSMILSLSVSRPAHAQFGGGGFEQMQQFAPMMKMMKRKSGKRHHSYSRMMRMIGPMMAQMMGGQGGGYENSGGMGGFDMGSMSSMMNPQMIGGMMQMYGRRPESYY
jgi:hypothetical protein